LLGQWLSHSNWKSGGLFLSAHASDPEPINAGPLRDKKAKKKKSWQALGATRQTFYEVQIGADKPETSRGHGPLDASR